LRLPPVSFYQFLFEKVNRRYDLYICGKVTKAYDFVLTGAENDRVARIESYIKDFTPMTLGILSLPCERGLMRLSALNFPGRQAMDVRYLRLTLLDN